MSSARIACPNPICPHDFTAEEYAAASACPSCGTALVSVPVAVPAIPYASPVSDAAPIPDPSPAVTLPSLAARRGAPLGVVVPILVTGLFFAFLAAGLLILFNRDSLFSDASRNATFLRELNCSFRKPDPRAWRMSEPWRRKLDGELAYERDKPTVAMVLSAHDYKSRNPRPDELQTEARRRIHALVRNATIDEPGDAPPLAGQPARRLVFQGEIGDVSMTGECSMFAYQGIGYWLLIWTPAAEVDRARAEFAALRSGLALMNERANWRETGGGTLFIAGDHSFSVRDVDGWWETNEPYADFAPQAQLALRLNRKKLRSTTKDPTAEVVVFVLPPTGPPLETARRFIAEWLRRGPYKEAALEDWQAQGAGTLPPAPAGTVGIFAAPQRLRVKKTPALSDFALLAAAEHDGQVFVVWCACQRPRDWGPAFRILLESFRFEGGK